MTEARSLIVNADDLGQCDGINRGIAVAHARGIVTSASLMVRWPAAASAVEHAGAAGLGLGLHLDLGEWVFRCGRWRPVYVVVDLDDDDAVRDEVLRQVDAFVRLTGRAPTHIDSHQHVHRRPRVEELVAGAAERVGARVRDADPLVRHCGAFYGQTAEGASRADWVSVSALVDLLHALPDGVTELVCHPGLDVDLETMYRAERAIEVETLCDPRARESVDALGIDLVSFAELP